MSTLGADDSFQDTTAAEENFPTAPLDDDIWLKDSFPDRHLCIHEQSQLVFLSLSIKPESTMR